MRYIVKYSEVQQRCITVEAASAEEAERMVMDGDVDYDESVEEDAIITSVNSAELVEP